MTKVDPEQVIAFWYSDAMRRHWFASTPAIDAEIRVRFEALWHQARDGELFDWEQTAEGCLALAIVLDQFPLNMFRGRAESFSTEAAAIAVVHRALRNGFDQQLPRDRLSFLYMPLMHSERLDDQNLAVLKFAEAGLADNERFARHHRDIIRRFGRFPHRNRALGRETTGEEAVWLDSPEGFSG